MPIRIGARSAAALRLAFGVRPESAWAEVGDGGLVIQFGCATFRTELANLERWRIEGPFRWITFAAALAEHGVPGEDVRRR